MALRNSTRYVYSSCFDNAREVVRMESVHPSAKFCGTTFFLGYVKYVQTASLKNRKVVPDSKPPNTKDVKLLTEFFDRSKKLVVLTGAGISTECGIPDYRSPNGAYSTGFRPIIHQDFIRCSRERRRYWARNYPIWKKFNEAKPGPAHTALASLEKANRISCLITQNIDGLHNRAGSSPVELHGTVHVVACLKCGFSFPRESFQDKLKSLNPKWAAAIESLSNDSKSDKNFGMKRIWGGGIEIDENFWENDLCIPTCSKCNGVLKPDVVFFGDNIANDRAKKARAAAKSCDAFLVLGSSLTTMFPLELVSMARKAGAAIAIINIGYTEADHMADLKINAQVGKILPLVLKTDSLNVSATSDFKQDK